MSALRIDPRVNVDRVYQYGEYQQLLSRHRRQKHMSWLEKVARAIGLKGRRRVVRLLPYKLAFGAGLGTMLLSLGAYAGLSADTARLQYERQDISANLASLGQAKVEAVESNTGAEMKVLQNAGAKQADVAYPARTEYVVVTNIPQAAGKRLVEDLYPLSKRLITVQP
jgi:hypothetical protein